MRLAPYRQTPHTTRVNGLERKRNAVYPIVGRMQAMRTRKIEIILLAVATWPVISALIRHVHQGQSVVSQQTTFALLGLVGIAAANIAVRSRKLALGILAVNGIFLLMSLVSVTLALICIGLSLFDEHSYSHYLESISVNARAIVFTGSLVVASCFQMCRNQTQIDTGQPAAGGNAAPPRSSA